MTEAARQDPAPAERPGRPFAAPALVAVCLLAAAGVYVYEKNHSPPATVHFTAVPPQSAAGGIAKPPAAQPVAAKAKPEPAAAKAAAAKAAAAQAAAAQQQVQVQQKQAEAAKTQATPATPARTAAAAAPAPATLAPATPAPAGAAPAAPAPAAAAAAIPTPPAPSVDVVRVDQYGALVMAGRAQPGETLTIHNGITMLGTVTADADGQWVFLPDTALPSGVHQLSIADQAAPASDAADHTTVLLSLPGAGGEGATASVPGTQLKSGPMIVLSQGDAPPRLLLAPPGSHPGPVGLDIVQYDEKGRIRFTGHAKPGRIVRLYVNNHAVGDALANAQGLWTLSPAADMPPGIYELRTDELAPSGRVMARSEVPFARATLAEVLAPGQAVVQPGDCLWTIARHNYGRGVEFTAIFEENLDQIRDPAKIYPGQAFHMPTPAEAAHAPPVSALKTLLQAAGRHAATGRPVSGGETNGG